MTPEDFAMKKPAGQTTDRKFSVMAPEFELQPKDYQPKDERHEISHYDRHGVNSKPVYYPQGNPDAEYNKHHG
jgi:hypothetical protein